MVVEKFSAMMVFEEEFIARTGTEFELCELGTCTSVAIARVCERRIYPGRIDLSLDLCLGSPHFSLATKT